MPSRMIKDGINESRGLASCSIFAQDLYKRLITYADDYGRFNADVQIMLARLYPLELAVITSDDLMKGLIELVGVHKIGFYTGYDKEKVYGAFPNWGAHQRLRESKKKNPDPDDNSVNDYYLQRFVPLEMKVQVIEKDEFKCQICGKHIAETEDARKLIKMGAGLFHIDHIVPVEQCGRATLENLRLTCPKCNLSRKKQFSFDEILKFSIDSGKKRERAESCGELPRVAARREEKGKEENMKGTRAHEDDASQEDGLISAEDAEQIRTDHDEIFDRLKYAGFDLTAALMDRAVNLYAEYGKEAVLEAIEGCIKASKPRLDYLLGCIKNAGKPKDEPGKVYMDDDEEREIVSKMFW